MAAEILLLEFINNLRYLLGIACCYRVANRQAYGMIGNIVSYRQPIRLETTIARLTVWRCCIMDIGHNTFLFKIASHFVAFFFFFYILMTYL